MPACTGRSPVPTEAQRREPCAHTGKKSESRAHSWFRPTARSFHPRFSAGFPQLHQKRALTLCVTAFIVAYVDG